MYPGAKALWSRWDSTWLISYLCLDPLSPSQPPRYAVLSSPRLLCGDSSSPTTVPFPLSPCSMWGLSPYSVPMPRSFASRHWFSLQASLEPPRLTFQTSGLMEGMGHSAGTGVGGRGQVVPWPCVLWPGRGNSHCCTNSRTAWCSHQEHGSSCDPQASASAPSHPPWPRLSSHSSDLIFQKAQRIPPSSQD